MAGHEWPLIGRAHALERVVRIAQHRERSGVIVVGAPGVGRTRFARAALAAISSAGPSTRSGNGEGPSWFTGWAMASRSTRSIPLGAMGPLLPDLQRGESSQGGLLHEARQVLLRARGDRRLLLGVDDVHLLDETSAVLLHRLASADDTFVVLCAPSGVAVPDPLFALWKEGLVERTDLRALTQTEHDELLVRVLGGHVDRATLARLWTLSLGNPLFLREVVGGGRTSGALRATGHVWRWDGPLQVTPRLAEIVRLRTDEAAPREQALMRLLAFGQPLGSDLASDLTSGSTLTALEERGLIVSRRTGRRVEVSLAHPLHGEVLRRGATALQEREVFQRLGDALEARGVRREEDRWRLLAWRTGQGASADPFELRRAAADVEPTDPRLAERLLREAAADGDPETSLDHARALVRLGHCGEAETVLDGLLEQADLPDDVCLSAATVRAHNRFWGLRDVDGARAAVDEALARPGADPRRAALYGFGLLLDGHDSAAAAAVQPDAAPDPSTLPELAVVALASARLGRPERARALARRGLEVEGPDPSGGWVRVELLCSSWFADLELGELDRAEELARRCHQEAISSGHGDRVALHATWLGVVAARRGCLRTAAQWLFEAAAGVSADRFVFSVPLVAELVIALLGLDSAARARKIFTESPAAGRHGLVGGWGEACRVWLAATGGRTSEAERIALEAADAPVGHTHRITALHAAVRLGLTGPVSERLTGLAEETSSPVAALYAAHGRALDAGEGEALDEVAERFSRAGMTLCAAEAAAQATAAHRAAGQPGAAGGSASRARAWLEHCEGAATPALDLLQGSVDLTRREMEVASLAASGMTSKAIAGQLVVSVRTVDNILRMVYAKLGVSGRGDLAQINGLRTLR